MPLPNHKVIPDGWSQHHRPTVEGAMTAEGRVDIPASAADATFDEATGRTVPGEPTTIYTGPMRVKRLPVGTMVQTVVIGDREIVLNQYRVMVPIDGPTQQVPVNAIVTVTACSDDPDLVGRPLKVRAVSFSTQAWDRVLLCEDRGPSTR